MQAGTLITPRLAEEAINSRLTCLPIESLPLTQCVGGTLRENIYAERDHPPFDRVTMDGIAVDSEALRRGLRRFRIQGIQAAGSPPMKLSGSEEAIEVMTGAILPVGSDCVIPVEQLRCRRRLCVAEHHGRHFRPSTMYTAAAATAARARCCWKPEPCFGHRKLQSRHRPAWHACG